MIKKIYLLLFFQITLLFNTTTITMPRPLKNGALSISAATTACYLIHNFTPIFVKTNNNFIHLQENDVSYLCYKTEWAEESQEAYVFAHGFRASGFSNNVVTIAKNNPTGTCYSMHFEDARAQKVFRTSLGQDPDITDFIRLLYILSKRYSALHVIGHSRGAATVINTIAILRQKNHPLILSIGIDEHTRQDILEKICKGSVVLKTPLLDVHYMYKWYFTRPLGPLVHYTCSFLTNFRYKPWGYQAIDSIELWNGLPVKLLVCFADNDSVVGNTLDQAFIEKTKTAIPDADIFFYKGDHSDKPTEYCQKLHDFYHDR